MPEREWTTHDEMQFLKGMAGGQNWPGGAEKRRRLLARYRDTMASRREWGMVDPEIINAYLSLELDEEIRNVD